MGVCSSHALPPPPPSTSQTELSDGIAMMVGNNDRMQGIISQLEEACRVIEVSVLLATHSRSKPHTNAPALTCTHPHRRTNGRCVSLSPPPSDFYLSARCRWRGRKLMFSVPRSVLHSLSHIFNEQCRLTGPGGTDRQLCGGSCAAVGHIKEGTGVAPMCHPQWCHSGRTSRMSFSVPSCTELTGRRQANQNIWV